MPNKVLVVRRRYLGDVVLLGPVLANLRREWPNARLAAVVEPAYAPVLAMNPDVDHVLTLPSRTFEWPGFFMRLRGENFTHVLDLDNNERTAAISRISGAPCRLALAHERFRWKSVYTHTVYDPPARHETRSIVDYYLEALSAINVPVKSREVRLIPRPADVESVAKILRPPTAGRRPQVVVHPGTRSSCRQWPAENFAAVCDRVQDELDAQVFLVGGPGDQAVIAGITALAKAHVVAINAPLPITQFTALASQVDLLLCHDSGPMHLAAAVGTRVIALLGSQNPTLFAPQGPGHTVLQPPLPCTACIAPSECVPGDSYKNYCVQNITVDRVIQAVAAGLSKNGSR